MMKDMCREGIDWFRIHVSIRLKIGKAEIVNAKKVTVNQR